MSTADWRASRAKRVQARVISRIGYPLIAALGSTFRWRQEGVEHLEAVRRSRRQPIMAFWHGRILPATVYFRRRCIVVITSENFDGTARGSTSRGAVKALVQLKRDMAAGKPAGFTLDGPRGPANVAQPGAVWLAKATGNPIIPFHIESDRHWTANSWDHTQIPKPWSNVAIVIGEPLEVPPGADDAAMEQARLVLEARLKLLEARALAML
jgi:lysophospholipid acyltransferase (LPLAT)-like uncharacterized protein